jgi:predicted nucleic acid-binding protein
MDTNPAVIFDACVLFPAPLLHLLVELAAEAQNAGLFRAKWTDRIHDEWISNLLERRKDLTLEQLTRTRENMNAYVDDCLVTGYEHRIKTLTLDDEDDRHVLAAAIECKASIIVTSDSDFFENKTELLAFGIVPLTPDQFVCDFLETYEDVAEAALERAVRSVKERLKNPPVTWSRYFKKLSDNKLVETVERLKQIIPADEISGDVEAGPQAE